MPPTPNLFILGAAKSGTTSLWGMLHGHPDVHMCTPKEPSFFCSHFQVVQNPVWYFQLFDSPRRWRGDASHVYMTNPETPPILHALFPQARFLVILRDPVARAHALYRHMRRHLHADGHPLELHETLDAALAAEDRRHSDPAFWAERRHYFWNYMYMRSGRFDQQLHRYLALFNRNQFHVLTLADLAANPDQACRGIAGFLDIDPAPLINASANVMNADPTPSAISDHAAATLAAGLSGVTARTQALVGHPLDWSM